MANAAGATGECSGVWRAARAVAREGKGVLRVIVLRSLALAAWQQQAQ